jgi:hypothetical protein
MVRDTSGGAKRRNGLAESALCTAHRFRAEKAARESANAPARREFSQKMAARRDTRATN